MSAKNTAKRRSTPARPALAESKPIAGKAAMAKSAKKIKKLAGKAEPKVKVVRDSFTMPQSDYMKIAELKLACLKAGLHVKKSELLRAGLLALGKLRMAQLKQVIAQLEKVKTGRPQKGS